MRGGRLGAQREARGKRLVSIRGFLCFVICACLLAALSGCGNKGPLVLEEDDQEKKQQRQTQDY